MSQEAGKRAPFFKLMGVLGLWMNDMRVLESGVYTCRQQRLNKKTDIMKLRTSKARASFINSNPSGLSKSAIINKLSGMESDSTKSLAKSSKVRELVTNLDKCTLTKKTAAAVSQKVQED